MVLMLITIMLTTVMLTTVMLTSTIILTSTTTALHVQSTHRTVAPVLEPQPAHYHM